MSDLTVLVAWFDSPPPASSIRELEEELGLTPVVRQLVPPTGPGHRREQLTQAVRRARRRARRGVARAGRRTGKELVKVRGGTRLGRAVVRLTADPRTLGDPQAAEILRTVLPTEGRVLLALNDSRSAAAAWEVGADYPHVVSVLGLPAAGRLAAAVRAAGVPWDDWADVAGDVDPDHVYAALPGLVDPHPIPPHALRDRQAAVTVPPAPAGPSLLIAPANYAGQGAAWVRAAGTHLGVPAVNLHVVKADSPFAFAADHPVTGAEWPIPAVRQRIAQEAVAPASHVLLEAMRPILDVAGSAASGWDFAAGAADARALQESGRTVAILLHGSESRRPADHAARYPHSPFRDRQDDVAVQRLTKATDNVHRLLDSVPDLRRFVSTPDMLDFVPGSTWLPVVVRRDAFRPGVPVLQRAVPVVLHAPSNPLMKGSDVVDAVLQQLHDEGTVEYRRLRDVPPALVADRVRDVDLVVDQIALGNLGVLALEAMACGRLVLGHALPEVMSRYGEDVPLLTVDPTDLRARVLEAVTDRQRSQELAAAGPEFVRRHHDGTRSAGVLADFLGVQTSLRSPGTNDIA